MNGQDPAQGLPHDIYGLFAYQTPWWVYGLFVLGGAVLLALLVLLVKRLAKARAATAKSIDPWDELAQRVKALAPTEPFVGRAAEDYFYQLSLLLREGIESRTKLNATDMTLQELREPLRKKLPLASGEIERVVVFLGRADEVKFAGAPSSLGEAADARRSVSDWIAKLKPREVTELAEGRTAHAAR